MAPSESDHENFIRTVLRTAFDLPLDDFKISEFEAAKNNHVYLIELERPVVQSLAGRGSSPKPFTCPIPANITRLVMRIPKQDVSMENSVRIRNEVAFLALARQALASMRPSLCPRVFAWDDLPSSMGMTGGTGWMLEEWKEGQTLSQESFLALDEKTQGLVLDQVASVTKLLQDYELPTGARSFGGLTFNDSGIMSNTKSPIPCGGPFPKYVDFLKGMCIWQLDAADRCQHLNGWRDVSKLRERLDTFFKSGLDDILSRIPEYRPSLVHGDLGE